ncbi:MAG: hypothetical protein V4504_00295 [Patescibacteria group bacterium]
MKISKENRLLFCIVILLLIEGVLFGAHLHEKKETLRIQNEIKAQKKYELSQKISKLSLEAKAISIYDVNDKDFVYGQNENLALPLASLTKTMTVLITFQEKEKTVNLLNLARFTMVSSSNEGAVELSLGIDNLIGKMNRKANEIGMTNTIFYNQTGLDIDETHAGAYGSAKDANILALYAFNTDNFFLSTTDLEADKIPNTNLLLSKVPNILFSKTGHTELAGGNLTIIWKNKNGETFVITILSSSKEARFTDMEKIINVL